MRVIATCAIWVAQVLYALMKAVSRPRRKVVFLSRQGDAPSRDFKMLIDRLERHDPSVEIVVRCRFIPDGLLGRIGYLAEVFAQMHHLASASVCVVDSYVVPVSVLTHRHTLFVVQTWHALGAIKKFGLQSLDTRSGRSASVARVMRMHRNYDAVLCAGPATVPFFAEAFGTDPARILPLGLPRIDYLLSHASDTLATTSSERIRDLAERFPRLAEKGRTIVMYAPTFRGSHTEPPRPRDVDALSELVAAFAGDRFTLIVKPHALKATGLSGEHVVDATGVDSLQLLPLCDVVVTDYSAIAFEAAVLDKPVFYFVYDLDEYSVEQGLNIDPLAEMPAAAARDAATLAERIASRAYDAPAARTFKDRYVSSAAGGCTDRIADMVIGHLPTE